jgi:menaquinol-cytochrome c reductase iron-sulfur subunit
MSPANDLHQEPRRSFLKVVTGILGGMLGAVTALPGLALLLHPATRETVRGGRQPLRVASLRELKPGKPLRVDVRGELVDAWSRIPDVKLGSCWLVRKPGSDPDQVPNQVPTSDGADQVRAFSTVCPHLGCHIELDENQQRFACPCHGSYFDLTSGQALAGPSPRGMDELEVALEGEDVKVSYRRFRVGSVDKEEV